MENARAVVGPEITPKSRIAVLIALGAIGGACAFAALAPRIGAEEAARAPRVETPDEKRWQAVAPGRIEPWSGEIKVAAPIAGVIGEVLVGANDNVFAGEPLIRLIDNEAQARLASAEAQLAMRKRARNDENPSSRAAARRKAEDAVADAEKAVTDAQVALDRAAAAKRARSGSDAELDAARSSLSRAQERLTQQKAELRRIERDPNTPLPTQAEGLFNVARAEFAAAGAAIEKLTIRAPRAGAVLQMNAKVGELAAPSSTQPLLLLGDISALRVRAELDEHDFGEIKIGQPVLVRAAAFRGRDFAGKVSFIAPLVEPGRINSRGQRNVTDVDVVEVLIDLIERDPLAVGMKVDVFFRPEAAQR